MNLLASFVRSFAGSVSRRATPWAVAVGLSAAALAPVAHAEVKVGVSDWPGWVAWYVAEQKGFFKKNGADVKLVWFANYTDSISALSSGQLDANSQTWSDTLGPLAKGLKGTFRWTNAKHLKENFKKATADTIHLPPKPDSAKADSVKKP